MHNGIIENFSSLRTALTAEGCVFRSETDTEIFAHLIAGVRRRHPGMPLDDVVREALQPVEGAFGIAVAFADRPDLLIGARHGSPLLLGVGGGDGPAARREFFLASDASAVIEHTQLVEYLNEREMVTITPDGYTISSIDIVGTVVGSTAAGGAAAGGAAAAAGVGAAGASAGGGPGSPLVRLREPVLHKLELSLEAIEKGGYKHFMLKEIMEQPRALRDAMRGRVDAAAGQIRLGGLEGEPLRRLASARRLLIAGCGTSHHSALVGEYLIELLARLPVEVEYASEFRYRKPVLFKDDVLVVLSQSGETADTLAAVREAKSQGVFTLGLVNVVGSTIARETDAGCYLHVGAEIGVASTKAFTGQVLLLAMLAVVIGRERGVLDAATVARHAASLAAVPDQMAEVLAAQADAVLDLARSYRFASSFLFLGRGFNYPVALEGALKLKEISYIHAEGYAAAEMKHGPIALIDKFMPCVVIAPSSDPVYDKLRSNIEEVLARGGSVVAVTEAGNEELAGRCEAVLHVPRTEEWLAPLLTVVPLQLLAYHIADLRKCNVDQPRNLAKSVTVE